jgi:hypothetical protein
MRYEGLKVLVALLGGLLSCVALLVMLAAIGKSCESAAPPVAAPPPAPTKEQLAATEMRKAAEARETRQRKVSLSGRAVAREFIEKNLRAPSTADVNVRALTQSGDYAMFHVRVDAQNAFGAKVRENYCVAVVADASGDWGSVPPNGAQKCSDPPTLAEIAGVKRVSGWPGASNP